MGTKPATIDRATVAHLQTTKLSIADIAGALQDAFGQKLTAYIAGLTDTKAIGEYARGDRAPRGDVEGRLRLAYQVFQIIVDADSDHVARAWFIGLNPQLNDDTPADAIRNDQLKTFSSQQEPSSTANPLTDWKLPINSRNPNK